MSKKIPRDNHEYTMTIVRFRFEAAVRLKISDSEVGETRIEVEPNAKIDLPYLFISLSPPLRFHGSFPFSLAVAASVSSFNF